MGDCFGRKKALSYNQRNTVCDILMKLKVMNGWMTGDFTSIFNSISVISGQCLEDNEKLYAMEPQLCLERCLPQAWLKPN